MKKNSGRCSALTPNSCISWHRSWRTAMTRKKRGFQIIRLQDSYQMVSRAEYAVPFAAPLRCRRTPSLSAAALEVLSIVAYRQPVTRAYIEQLRGVDSSNTVLNLLDKGLLEGCGRLDVPGRPMIYRHDTGIFACLFHFVSRRAAGFAGAAGAGGKTRV